MTIKSPLGPDERQSLSESARLCEMIVEANPADTGALETLKEIYTKLGDREKLARVVSALAVLPGVRSSVGVAGTKTEETSDVPVIRATFAATDEPDTIVLASGDPKGQTGTLVAALRSRGVFELG